jgi:splicing factor 3B subunit 4
MLASQARKHNVQPQTQPLPPLMGSQTPMGPGTPMMAGGMANGDAARPMPPSGPPDYSAGRGAMPLQVPPQPPRTGPPAPPMAAPLAAPPPGLPARPPPSQVGYGGPPPGFAPPGFNNAAPPTNYPPAPAPPGFAQPPGFGGAQGAPPPLPPGFQPPGYGRGR